MRCRRVFFETSRHVSRTRSRLLAAVGSTDAQRLARELVRVEVQDGERAAAAELLEAMPEDEAGECAPVGAAAQREDDPTSPPDCDRELPQRVMAVSEPHGPAGIGWIRFGIRGESKRLES